MLSGKAGGVYDKILLTNIRLYIPSHHYLLHLYAILGWPLVGEYETRVGRGRGI